MAGRADSINFSLLGIDVNASQMTILKAVMAAAGGPSIFVTYKEIAKHLDHTKAYIYRHLSNLNEEGYLVIDPVQTPRKYAISEAGIINSLKKKQEESLAKLQTRKIETSTKLNLLKNVNSESIAFVIYNQLMGLESSGESIIIEGIENVRSSIIREFGKPSKAGDEIRVIASASLLDGGLDQPGMTEMSLMGRAVDGVKIIGLLMPQGEVSFSTELIANFMENIGEAFMSLSSTGNITIRLAKENIKTYRMVCLNREKMLLYLTHAAESDMAALVHRKDNPGLIDDAVDTFDKIHAEGIDIIDMIKQLIAKE